MQAEPLSRCFLATLISEYEAGRHYEVKSQVCHDMILHRFFDNNSIFADIKQKSATYDFRNDEIQFSETIHQYETISYAHLTQSVKVISSHKKQLKHY